MDSSILDLIDSATVNGDISEEERNYILNRAREVGVDEMEVNIIIKAKLKNNQTRNSITQIVGGNAPRAEEGWLKFRDFKLANWVTFVGVVLIFVSGLFPWIESSVSSGGYGASYSGGATAGGGIFFTLPLGIAAIYFAMKRSLFQYSTYYGIFIIVFAIMIAVSYGSSSNFSGSGVSASASTTAGPGVAILGLAGIIYLLGYILKRGGIKEALLSQRSILAYIVFFIIIPFGFNRLNDGSGDVILKGLFWGVTPYLISRNQKYEQIKKVFIGNLTMWVLVILIPPYSEILFIKQAISSIEIITPFYQYIFLIVSLTALYADFLESKQKKLSIFEDIKHNLKPVNISLAILIPFFLITFYLSIKSAFE